VVWPCYSANLVPQTRRGGLAIHPLWAQHVPSVPTRCSPKHRPTAAPTACTCACVCA
jgi:hypothetical protein